MFFNNDNNLKTIIFYEQVEIARTILLILTTFHD